MVRPAPLNGKTFDIYCRLADDIEAGEHLKPLVSPSANIVKWTETILKSCYLNKDKVGFKVPLSVIGLLKDLPRHTVLRGPEFSMSAEQWAQYFGVYTDDEEKR